jgi:hypothetical protein
MRRSFRGFDAIDNDGINPAPAFVPFAEHPNWSDKFAHTGKLAGLLKRSIILGNDGD